MFLACRHAPCVCIPVLPRNPDMRSLHLLVSPVGAAPCRNRVPVTGAPAARPRPLGPAPLSQAQVHKPEVRSLPRSGVAGAVFDPRCDRNWSPGEVLPLAPPTRRPSSWRPQAWGCSWHLACRCCPPAGAKRHRTLPIARLHSQTLVPVGACLQRPP